MLSWKSSLTHEVRSQCRSARHGPGPVVMWPKSSGTSYAEVLHADSGRVAFGPGFQLAAVHEIQELLGRRADNCGWGRLTHPVQFRGSVEESLILVDRTTDRSAKLVAYQQVLNIGVIGEPIVGRQCL